MLRPANIHPCAIVRPSTLILVLQLTNRSSATERKVKSEE